MNPNIAHHLTQHLSFLPSIVFRLRLTLTMVGDCILDSSGAVVSSFLSSRVQSKICEFQLVRVHKTVEKYLIRYSCLHTDFEVTGTKYLGKENENQKKYCKALQ